MFFIRSQQHVFATFNDPGRSSIMDVLGSEKTYPRVVVLGIVPGKECLAKGPGILDRAEPLRELGSVLHGLELRFGVGIVITDRGPRMALGDPEISHEQGNGL